MGEWLPPRDWEQWLHPHRLRGSGVFHRVVPWLTTWCAHQERMAEIERTHRPPRYYRIPYFSGFARVRVQVLS